MSFYYANLRHGNRFKVPGYDTIYVRVRVRGGYRRADDKRIPPHVIKTGLGNGPVKDGLIEVELVVEPDDYSKVIDAIGERRRQEQVELNTKVGEPSIFVPDPDDSRFGTGYWKAKGGVISYRKYANGYDPLSRMEYTNEFIELLNKVKGD
jgi:hypothetical protein